VRRVLVSPRAGTAALFGEDNGAGYVFVLRRRGQGDFDGLEADVDGRLSWLLRTCVSRGGTTRGRWRVRGIARW
jgi:hypothetical protein